MLCLGVEGTAHTFGVGIVDEHHVLANTQHSYMGIGIHPRKAADHHAEYASSVVDDALREAHVTLPDIEVFSFSQGPGMGPCLRIAATLVRTLSLKYEKPMVGVNHCVAHVEVGRWSCGIDDPVTLYVSGGNTQIIAYAGERYRVFGETLDIGIGNMQDVFGRGLGLSFPCGKEMDEMLARGSYIPGLPYTVKGMDFGFSGLLTEAQKRISSHKKEDIVHSLMMNAYSMVVEATERAMSATEKTELLLTGGVAASPKLKEMCGIMAQERGATFYVPHPSLCRDNGAMIAYQGLLEYMHGKATSLAESRVRQKWRTDEVDVTWRK